MPTDNNIAIEFRAQDLLNQLRIQRVTTSTHRNIRNDRHSDQPYHPPHLKFVEERIHRRSEAHQGSRSRNHL